MDEKWDDSVIVTHIKDLIQISIPYNEGEMVVNLDRDTALALAEHIVKLANMVDNGNR